MDLTEAILTLDKESERDLKNANSSNLNEKEKIDNYIQKSRRETRDQFEDQKIMERSALDTKLEKDLQDAIRELKEKMKTFDEEVDINAIAENLLALVRKRVCH